MKKENKIYFFIFLFLVLSLMMFCFAMYAKFNVLKKIEIVANLKIGDISGFDVNTSVLTFGTITSGSSSYREITIENNYEFPIKAEFRSSGNITELLLFDESIYLDTGENKSIVVNTIIPVSEEKGFYSGRFIAVIKKSWKDI